MRDSNTHGRPVEIGNAVAAPEVKTTAATGTPDPYVSLDLGLIPPGWYRGIFSVSVTADANNTIAWFELRSNGAAPPGISPTEVPIPRAGLTVVSTPILRAQFPGGPTVITVVIARHSGVGEVNFEIGSLSMERVEPPS